MIDEDGTLPTALAEAHDLPWWEGREHYDFQPFDEFMWSVEMVEMWQNWINDRTAATAPLRAFGQDSAGGLVAFWARNPSEPVETQAVVYLSSEGEFSAIAENLGDYLWLLAQSVGPVEVVSGYDHAPSLIRPLVALAQQYTGLTSRSLDELREAARMLSQEFQSYVYSVAKPGW